MRFLLVLIISIFFNLPVHAACLNPDGVPGELMYNGNYDVFQGCTLRGWKAFHAPGPFRNLPPKDCPDFGNTCADGTLFAGFHPVTGAALFAMQVDAPMGLAWNDGTLADRHNLPAPMLNCLYRIPDPGALPADGLDRFQAVSEGCYDGQAYTVFLAAQTNPPDLDAPYQAAQYCADLTPETDSVRALGHNDWYLPSAAELSVLFKNLGPEPSYNFKSNNYWSSSENSGTTAWFQNFQSGGQSGGTKNAQIQARCIRQN